MLLNDAFRSRLDALDDKLSEGRAFQIGRFLKKFLERGAHPRLQTVFFVMGFIDSSLRRSHKPSVRLIGVRVKRGNPGTIVASRE